MPRRTNIQVGDRFGFLAVEAVVQEPAQRLRLRCRCDCGETLLVRADYVRRASGKRQRPSCGCGGAAPTPPAVPAAWTLCAHCVEDRYCRPGRSPFTGRAVMLCKTCAGGAMMRDAIDDSLGDDAATAPPA